MRAARGGHTSVGTSITCSASSGTNVPKHPPTGPPSAALGHRETAARLSRAAAPCPLRPRPLAAHPRLGGRTPALSAFCPRGAAFDTCHAPRGAEWCMASDRAIWIANFSWRKNERSLRSLLHLVEEPARSRSAMRTDR